MRFSPLLLLAVPISNPAIAQQATVAAPVEPVGETDEVGDDIVVVGGRERGSVVGDIKPEVVLRGADIRAYGASDLGELLEALAPLTGSNQGGGGPPVTLLDGRRISNFREIRDLPPEAVVRVDILPEEVALKYGYRPDQKVVNFVLRPRFRATTVEADVRAATAGGRQTSQIDGNFLRLMQGTRLSLDGEYSHATPLFESERNLVAPDPDRTLLSASDALKLNGTYNRMILGNVSATINSEFNAQDTRGSLGRSSSGDGRLIRDSRTRSGALGYALNGASGEWRWSLDGGYTRDWSTTLTDRPAGRASGRDLARTTVQALTTTGTANGALFKLPAGPVTATFRAAADLTDIEGVSRRVTAATDTKLARDNFSGQANVDLPISRKGAVGDLSLNGNAAIEHLSDFGTLRTVGFGVNWTPVRPVRLIASVTFDENAPSVQDLGNPVLITPNVQLLDLTTGTSVNVTRVTGGNPDLVGSDRRVSKLGVTLRPFDKSDFTILGTYTDTRVNNATGTLPAVTPELEAAFRDRFTRDASGTLLRIDSRPVNFARTEQRAFRWGINWSKALRAPVPVGADGKPLTAEEIAARRQAFREQNQGRGSGEAGAGAGGANRGGEPNREGGGGRGAGRGFGGPGGGGNQGRLTFSIFHNWRLSDTILIRPGVAELDLLEGSAIGATGGVSRHEVEAQAGYNRNGLGVRASANWQSATQIRQSPGGAPSPRDLRFGSLATLNLRLFADLGAQRDLVRAHPFFRGARVTIGIDNLFDQRLDVRDAMGATPLGYQPDRLNPLGRAVRISFRKLFLPAFGSRRR